MFKVNNKETRTTPKASSMPTVQLPHLFNPTIPQKTSNPNLSKRHFVAFSNISLETRVPKLYNSKTNDDINMKLELITKFDKRTKTTSKK